MSILLLLAWVVLVVGLFGLLRCSTAHGGGVAALLAMVMGLSATGLTYSFSLFAGLSFAVFVALSGALSIMVMARAWMMGYRPSFSIPSWSHGVAYSIVVALVLANMSYVIGWASNRWGDWDAWAIWSLHGKFLQNVGSWQQAMHLRATHPDYPMMLPSILACLWNAVGGQDALVPEIVALGVLFTTVAVVFFGVRERADQLVALGALVVLGSDVHFIDQAVSKYADTMLALFIVATVIGLVALQSGRNGHAGVVGFLAASATWVKNEGVVFFLLCALIVLFTSGPTIRKLMTFLIGALPALLVLIWFKTHFAPPNDIASSRNGEFLIKLTDPSRYRMIVVQVLDTMHKGSPFFLPAVLATFFFGWKHREIMLPAFLLVGVGIAYFFVYVITPLDLGYHLATSSDRLLHHALPAWVLLGALSIGQRCHGPAASTLRGG